MVAIMVVVVIIVLKSAEHTNSTSCRLLFVSFSGPAISFRALLKSFILRSRPYQLPKDNRPSRAWKIEVSLEEGQGHGRGRQGPGPPRRTPVPRRLRPCLH